MKKDLVVIPNVCCEETCKKRPTSAVRFSDGWLSRCDEHQNGAITMGEKALNLMNKAVEESKRLKAAA